MWSSLVAMCIASIGVTLSMIDGIGKSTVIGLMVSLFEEFRTDVLWFISVPILGLIGWFTGRFIVHADGPDLAWSNVAIIAFSILSAAPILAAAVYLMRLIRERIREVKRN
jgi:hypothetical protein